MSKPPRLERRHTDCHARQQIKMQRLLSFLGMHAGHLRLEEGTQMVMPGDNFRTDIELTLPVALEVGVRFAIRDSGRTVGAGVVTELGK